MSHSHEPSYYEIALTNRQVLVVFVVLLVCVVAAFFSGVWVGRRDVPGLTFDAAQDGAVDPEENAVEAAAIGELHFFAEQEGRPAEESTLTEIADEPQAETTLLEDLEGGEPQTEAVAEEVAQQVSSPPASVPSSEPSAAVGLTGGYVIQVFSSAEEVQARRLLKRLSDGGYPAFLSPVQVGSQTMMRVRIGPYSELQEAESIAGRIRREFKLDTWITQ